MPSRSLVLAFLQCAVSIFPAAGQGYGGYDPNAAWREPARQRIEAYRKGDIEILVIDESGEPVSNAAVHVSLKKHSFGFGTAVATGLMIGPNLNPAYRTKIRDLTGDGRGFNMAVLENALKWPGWESRWPVTNDQTVTVVNYLRSRGLDVRGHNLVWPRWDLLPEDLEENRDDLAYITDRIEGHIRQLAGRIGLKGVLREWDVVNEPVHVTDLRNAYAGRLGYRTGEEIYTHWFRWAEESDPHARLFINEYNIVSQYGSAAAAGRAYYKHLIKVLLGARVKLDGIGIQAHMSGSLTPIDTVYKVLEEFGSLGPAIAITEYDAANAGEEIAADYLRDFLTIVFSHPAVESFLMWGFWDGAHWRGSAPIFREDWSLKPSGQAFIDLVFDEWWTDETGTTGADGAWATRGFLGDYEVSVSYDGQTIKREFKLSREEPAAIVVSTRVTRSETESPGRAFHVDPVFPDPFLDKTNLSFYMPRSGNVQIEVFDMSGRKVGGKEYISLQEGHQILTVDASQLPSGSYILRLTAGSDQYSGRLHHVR